MRTEVVSIDPRTPFTPTLLAETLAAVASESDELKPVAERVHISSFPVQTDLRPLYASGSEREKRETNSGYLLREQLLAEDGRGFGVWISPPGEGYGEGRLAIYSYNKEEKEFVVYGIPFLVSAQRCLQLANQLSEFSSLEFAAREPEDLRDQVMVIPDWQVITEVIDLPEVWAAIESGAARKLVEERLKAGKVVAEKYGGELRNVRTLQEGVAVSRKIERAMGELGHRIGTGCPTKISFEVIMLNLQGEVVGVKGTDAYKCGVCQEWLDTEGHSKVHLNPGDRCPHCGEPFSGRCG